MASRWAGRASGRRDGGGSQAAAAAPPHIRRDSRLERLEEYVVGSRLDATYLNASSRGILHLKGLREVPKLETAVLRDNGISVLTGLDKCPQLWRIDLANNRVSDLSGLERFSALGELDLMSNAVTWQEVFKLKHIQLLSLTLTGNPIEREDRYRYHVIDILPRLWLLDGVLITAAERAKVKSYFTAVTSNPKLRRKYARTSYTPTSMRNVALTGVFGQKTMDLSRLFPLTLTHSADLDFRRLVHLCVELESKLLDATSYRLIRTAAPRMSFEPPDQTISLKPALMLRADRRNMLYFLMVSTLVYAIPSNLLRGTLMLTGIGDGMEGLFFMPLRSRAEFAALLGSVSDLFVGKPHEESMYPQLRRCLQQFTSRVLHAASPKQRRTSMPKPSITDSDGYSVQFRMSANARGRIMQAASTPPVVAAPAKASFGNLLAVELGQLLCLVPEFPGCIGRDGDAGLIKIMEECTEDPHIYAKIMALVSPLDRGGMGGRLVSPESTTRASAAAPELDSETCPSDGGEVWLLSQSVAPFLMDRIHKNATAIGEHTAGFSDSSSLKEMLGAKSRRARSTSASPTRSDRRLHRPSSAAFRRSIDFRIGETVHTASGQTARIIAIPTSTAVNLQFNPFTAPFKAETGTPTFEQVHKDSLTRDSRGRLYMERLSSPRRSRSARSSNTTSRESTRDDDVLSPFDMHRSTRSPHQVPTAAENTTPEAAPPPLPTMVPEEPDDILYEQLGADEVEVDDFQAEIIESAASGKSSPSNDEFASFSGVSVQVTHNRATERRDDRDSDRPRESIVLNVVSLSEIDVTNMDGKLRSPQSAALPSSPSPPPRAASDSRSPRGSLSPSSPHRASTQRSVTPGTESQPKQRASTISIATWDSETVPTKRLAAVTRGPYALSSGLPLTASSQQRSSFMNSGTWDTDSAAGNTPGPLIQGQHAHPHGSRTASGQRQSVFEPGITVRGSAFRL